jgi:POT family proton-dependent oligopeptide transporter
MSQEAAAQDAKVFGHPTGLFMLFFAEMWERFSYYGMRALLLFYMIKGFLGFNDQKAYAVYGAYTALVYATPFIGGMLADRFFGARRAVILGGILMAAGHLTMTLENQTAFFVALALLICGNGFFKPNISTIVGSLYPKGSGMKDAGFTLFYMGINLGAAMSPVICGYVGETYGWHYGFGLATGGMLLGVIVFVAPIRLSQILILVGALSTAIAMPFFQDTWLQLAVRIFLGLALAVAGLAAAFALGKGGLPKDAGAPSDPEAHKKKIGGILRADWALYLGVALSIPFFALLVSRNQYAGWALTITGVLAIGYLLYGMFQSTRIERERMYVVLILMFFSMLFWAFFEQAGSSVSNFTDRNIDRVSEARQIKASEVGKTLTFRIPIVTKDPALAKLPVLSQEQLGYTNGGSLFSLTYLDKMRGTQKKIAKAQAAVKQAGQDAKTTAKNKAELAALLKKMRQLKRFRLAGKQTRLALLTAILANAPETGKPNDAQRKALRLAHKAAIKGVFKKPEARKAFLDKGTIQPAKVGALKKAIGPNAVTLIIAGELAKDAYQAYRKKLTKEANQLRKAIKGIQQNSALLTSNTKAAVGMYYWKVDKSNVGMGVGGSAIPASEFQATNPIFILIFGLFFTALWSFLRVRNLEPSTPIKFALGILQLGLGFGALWYGAQHADARGMVAMSWLLLGYLLHTTGELCLSPVGLSMVTKLSPARLVSTVMGAWFLATAFSNYLASMIAALTGVSHGGGGGGEIPAPIHTVHIYGGVFGKIAIAAIVSALICFALAPLLTKWMHEDAEDATAAPQNEAKESA